MMSKAKTYLLKDSGARREFKTGAVRDIQEGKGRFDLIPPTALKRLAQVFEKGAIKYGDGNYLKGIPLSAFVDSAERHLNQVKQGAVDEDHAAQCAWNMFALMWTEEQIEQGKLPTELDNRKFKI
mgnify:FL=1